MRRRMNRRKDLNTLPLYEASLAINVGRPRLEARIKRTGFVFNDVRPIELDDTYRVPVRPLAAALGMTPEELLAYVDARKHHGHDDAPAG